MTATGMAISSTARSRPGAPLIAHAAKAMTEPPEFEPGAASLLEGILRTTLRQYVRGPRSAV